MNILTNMLYLVSTGLLIPVIVLLLAALVWSLLMMGGFYGLYMSRLKFKKHIRNLLDKLRSIGIHSIDFDKELSGDNLFIRNLKRMRRVNWHAVHSEKIIVDFETQTAKALESSKTLMRIGPMLGLMGTLIPMGPALVGLASGDIASMAVNMQVAFSTTVIGIFVGAIGYITQLVKQRWFLEDINTIEYIYELAKTGREKREKIKEVTPAFN